MTAPSGAANWDAPGGEVAGEGFQMTAAGCVGNENFVGQGGDEVIAARGEFGGDAPGCLWKAGEEQHPATGYRDVPLGGQPLQHSPRGAENDRGIAT